MSEFDEAIKLQKRIDELKVGYNRTLKEGAIDQEYLIKIAEKVEELEKLGYEYMKHNMTSSIRKIRSDDD